MFGNFVRSRRYSKYAIQGQNLSLNNLKPVLMDAARTGEGCLVCYEEPDPERIISNTVIG